MKAKLIVTTLLAAPLMVAFVASTRIPLTPASTLWVEGTSTVRGFKCTAKTLDAQVVGDPSAGVAEMVTGANVAIPVEQLDCGNGTMNEHMRKALQADKNPQIEFALSSYDLNGSNATLKGTLEIAGTTRPITIPATVSDAGKEIRVKATTQIDMKEWGVKPPSLMLGTMKVNPNVKISFDVGVKR